ncbi:MAG: DUF6134 family protein [Pseudomonadota bacterium]
MLDRRTLLTGGAMAGALALCPLPAMAAGPRVFDLYRADKKIGSQTLTVDRSGQQINVAVSIDIKVRIMGIPAYTYQLESREVWAGGTLQQLRARTNDNGTDNSVTATRTTSGLRVDGTKYAGMVKGNPATTTYWTQAFLQRPTWISTQDGTPMNVSAQKAGTLQVPTPTGPTNATVWQIRGDIGELDLYYDRNGEWVGNAFTARGERARFVLARRGLDIARLWSNG